jgi:hypothetical protein
MVVKDSSGKEIPSTAPAIVDEDASTGQATLTWFVEMGVDRKYFKETMLPILEQCLAGIAGVKPEYFTSKTGHFHNNIGLFHNEFDTLPGKAINNQSIMHTWDAGFFLVKSISRTRDTIEALIYPNTKNELIVHSQEELSGGHKALAYLVVRILDSDGEMITTAKEISWQPFATSQQSLVMIGPYAKADSVSLILQIPIVQKISVCMPIELLKEVKKVELSLEQVPFKLGLAKKE